MTPLSMAISFCLNLVNNPLSASLIFQNIEIVYAIRTFDHIPFKPSITYLTPWILLFLSVAL